MLLESGKLLLFQFLVKVLAIVKVLCFLHIIYKNEIRIDLFRIARSIYSEGFLKLNYQLPLLFCHFRLIMFLQAVNRPSANQRYQPVFLIKLLSTCNARVPSQRNSNTTCHLSGLLQFFVIVFNRLNCSEFDWFLFLNKNIVTLPFSW